MSAVKNQYLVKIKKDQNEYFNSIVNVCDTVINLRFY